MKRFMILLFPIFAIISFTACNTTDYDFFSTIRVSVVDDSDMQPVEGVFVYLSPGGISGLTDVNGYIEFTDLEARQYTITVQKTGYSTNRKILHAFSGETMDVSITIKKNEGL